MSVAMKRTKQLNLKLSEEELSALQQLALSYGISEQNVLRMLVRRDHLERSAHKRTMGLEELGEQIARHLDGARRRRNEKR